MPRMLHLSMDACTAQAAQLVQEQGRLVVTAAPGAGKSTRLPPALLAGTQGAVWVLQPRRVAARALAARVASEQGWQLGHQVGFATRQERRGNAQTRLWYATEGILARRLHDDPTLEGIGCVVLDEFHERSVHADVLLGHLRDLRRELRPDLQVVVMSATLDAAPIAAFLDQAPVLDVPGSGHALSILWRAPEARERMVEHVCRVIQNDCPDDGQGVLVFLPGSGEIHACAALLEERGETRPIQLLYGSQRPDEQDRVLSAVPGSRIILATNIAETSLTVPGVRTVVDSGWHRVDRYDPEAGVDRLELEGISRFQAIQRAGRAAREGAGRAIRLWSSHEDQRRDERLAPQIQRVDPVPVVLDLAAWWGAAAEFPWLDAPPEKALAEAQADLQARELLSTQGRITERGKQVARLPVHPRLGLLLVLGAEREQGALASWVAALLDGREVVQDEHLRFDDDVAGRLELLASGSRALNRSAAQEVREVAFDLQRLIGVERTEAPRDIDRKALHGLLLAALPDRLARRSAPGANRVQLASGVTLELAQQSACYLPPGRRDGGLVLVLQAIRLRSRGALRSSVRLAIALEEADIAEQLHEEPRMVYDRARDVVDCARVLRCGRLIVRHLMVNQVDPLAVSACLFQALAPEAEALALAHPELGRLLARRAWAVAQGDIAAEALPWSAQLAKDLLRQACDGLRSRAQVLAVDWLGLYQGHVEWSALHLLDQQAPSTLRLPSGRLAAIDYAATAGPAVECQVQECYSWNTHPTLGRARRPMVLHLLAPSKRPVQVTSDLPGFWAGSYALVRKDLRGRYPKHAWPDDPASHPPCQPNGRPQPRGQ